MATHLLFLGLSFDHGVSFDHSLSFDYDMSLNDGVSYDHGVSFDHVMSFDDGVSFYLDVLLIMACLLIMMCLSIVVCFLIMMCLFAMCRLTAFVTKCFVQSMRLRGNLVTIDPRVVKRSVMWMVSKQLPAGEFPEPGEVFDTTLQVGSNIFFVNIIPPPLPDCK